MAEIRKFDFDKVCAYVPSIPENWYIPAKDLWKMTAWCFMQLRNNNCVHSDKDVRHFVHHMEEWIEDHSVSIGKEIEDENTSSN